MIPVVLLLDTVAFIRQVGICIQGLAKSTGFHWLRPGYIGPTIYCQQQLLRAELG